MTRNDLPHPSTISVGNGTSSHRDQHDQIKLAYSSLSLIGLVSRPPEIHMARDVYDRIR